MNSYDYQGVMMCTATKMMLITISAGI